MFCGRGGASGERSRSGCTRLVLAQPLSGAAKVLLLEREICKGNAPERGAGAGDNHSFHPHTVLGSPIGTRRQGKIMKKGLGKIALFALLIAVVLLLRFTVFGEYITFEKVKENSGILWRYVEAHYFRAVLIFIVLYISTAFFVPGTLMLTITGGFLFGVLPGTLYATLGALTGASLAFLTSRYLAGNWVQERYRFHLLWLNEEIRRNGPVYLISLRVIPVVPFFLVNFLAGLTRTSYWTFLWTTFAGMLPGSVVYSFAGQQLRTVTSLEDIFSPGFVLALVVMTLLLLGPILWKRKRKTE